jgi:hypothetical protein
VLACQCACVFVCPCFCACVCLLVYLCACGLVCLCPCVCFRAGLAACSCNWVDGCVRACVCVCVRVSVLLCVRACFVLFLRRPSTPDPTWVTKHLVPHPPITSLTRHWHGWGIQELHLRSRRPHQLSWKNGALNRLQAMGCMQGICRESPLKLHNLLVNRLRLPSRTRIWRWLRTLIPMLRPCAWGRAACLARPTPRIPGFCGMGLGWGSPSGEARFGG